MSILLTISIMAICMIILIYYKTNIKEHAEVSEEDVIYGQIPNEKKYYERFTGSSKYMGHHDMDGFLGLRKNTHLSSTWRYDLVDKLKNRTTLPYNKGTTIRDISNDMRKNIL